MSRQSKMRRKKAARIANTSRRPRKSGVRAARLAERRQREQQTFLRASLEATAQAQKMVELANRQLRQQEASERARPSESLQTIHLPRKPDLTPRRLRRG
jgi:hypothetical protein